MMSYFNRNIEIRHFLVEARNKVKIQLDILAHIGII